MSVDTIFYTVMDKDGYKINIEQTSFDHMTISIICEGKIIVREDYPLIDSVGGMLFAIHEMYFKADEYMKEGV